MKLRTIKPFDDIGENDLPEVGGKALSLSKLKELGYSVPDGFVVTSSAFHDYLFENNILDDVSNLLSDPEKTSFSLSQISKEIATLISGGKHNTEIVNLIKSMAIDLNSMSFAVRSSSSAEDGEKHSWAGQMTTVLGVSVDDIADAIKVCWSSFFSPQALNYRKVNSLTFEIGDNAVIIQKMVKSEYSGVAFSVDPRFGDNCVVIEAVCGLGEALVSGTVVPVRYIFDKNTFELTEYVHTSQKKFLTLDSSGGLKWGENGHTNDHEMDNDILRELLGCICSLEKSWGCHVDVEWAVEDNKLYIVQCRPITNFNRLC